MTVYDEEGWPHTDRELGYDMYRFSLDVAEQHARQMRKHLEDAQKAVHWQEREPATLGALDEAWRVESALGAVLSMDDVKAEQAGYRQTKERTREAFDTLREPLRDAETRAHTSDRELQGYVADLALVADLVIDQIGSARDAIGGERFDGASSGAPRATVALAHSRRKMIGQGTIDRLVRQAVDQIGGIGAFVHPGQSVLIKPNQTTFFLAHEGVTTDPRMVKSLIMLAREAGASRVVVGESSGGGDATRSTLKVTGMLRAAKGAGAEVLPFDEVEQREVEIPGGRYIKRISLPSPLLDADVIINAPKLKVHHMDPISGAIKNWVGCLRADIREHFHDWHAYQQYSEIMTVTRPALSVMDGIFLGEGNGPVACKGRRFGAIIASADPVALDVTAARLLGFDPRHVTFATVAASYGLGQIDPAQIDLVGAPFDEVRTTVEAPRIGMDYIPANIIVGTGVSHSGTMGHFKSVADLLFLKHIWSRLIDRLHGKPTVLIGDAEDPLFETHVKEGPYVVIDDAAPARYREDPRVFFIPGHPVLHNMLPLLLEGLRIQKLGEAGEEAMKLMRGARSRIRPG